MPDKNIFKRFRGTGKFVSDIVKKIKKIKREVNNVYLFIQYI